MSFFSSIFTDIENFFTGSSPNTGTTLATVIAKINSVMPLINLVVEVAESDVSVPAATKTAINTAMTNATNVISTLAAEPTLDNVQTGIKALSDVVAAFPAGPRHNEAAAIMATVQVVFVAAQVAGL